MIKIKQATLNQRIHDFSAILAGFLHNSFDVINLGLFAALYRGGAQAGYRGSAPRCWNGHIR
jgi:hypothetical protein